MSNKLKYFPFNDQPDQKMGTVAFKQDDQLVEVDHHYLAEISLKRSLLEKDHRYYYQSAPGTEAAQWDAVELVLNSLSRFEPGWFQLSKDNRQWNWQNRKTGENICFTFGQQDTLPYEPLDWLGRQVQEDLLILSNDHQATLVAGQLCFANGYSLDDKFGHSFLTIHAPAPKMIGPIMDAAQKLMERLPVNRPVWRASWNLKISDELDLSSRHNERYRNDLANIAATLNENNIGKKLFIRIERQTLTRLPVSNCILFGIHTYQNTLEEESLQPERKHKILQTLKHTPREMLNYKAIAPFEKALFGYLEK